MKRQLMRFTAAFIILLVWGCSPQLPSTARDSSGRTAIGRGFTINVPAKPGWVVRETDSIEAACQNNVTATLIRLVAYPIATDPVADDESFLKSAEANQEAAFRGLEMESLHFNYGRLNGAVCLQYDGVFRDTLAAMEQRYLTTKGYLCRHPAAVGRAVALEYTQRSASRNPPDEEHNLALAAEFFGSVVFASDGPGR